MKKLILRRRFFLAAATFCAAGLAAALALRFSSWDYCTVFSLMGGTLAAVLFFAAHKNFISAQLIVDNTILRIQPVFLQARDDGSEDAAFTSTKPSA